MDTYSQSGKGKHSHIAHSILAKTRAVPLAHPPHPPHPPHPDSSEVNKQEPNDLVVVPSAIAPIAVASVVGSVTIGKESGYDVGALQGGVSSGDGLAELAGQEGGFGLAFLSLLSNQR